MAAAATTRTPRRACDRWFAQPAAAGRDRRWTTSACSASRSSRSWTTRTKASSAATQVARGGMRRRRRPPRPRHARRPAAARRRRRRRRRARQRRRRWRPRHGEAADSRRRRRHGGQAGAAARASRPSARTSPTPPSGTASLDDRQGRHRRGRARHAGEPHRLEGQRLGMGHGTKVGQGEAEVVTTQGPARPPAGPAVLRAEGRSRPVGQRPQLPQDGEDGRRSSLELEGGTLDADRATPTQTVEIAAGGEQRVDWRVKVDAARARPSSA